MAGLMVAFLAALLGVFVMRSALAGDRRLVVAGLPAGDAVLSRLVVLIGLTLVAVVVSALVLGLVLTPASWSAVITAVVLMGLLYAAIGALVGTLLDRLPATYLILFLVMTDLGVVQSPMFHATPTSFSWLLPGYAVDRLLFAGAFSPSFHATGALLLALAWLAALSIAVYLALRRAVRTRT
jgi:hypothetical protein